MGNYKQFEIEFLNTDKYETITKGSEDGGIWIKIGELSVRIKQYPEDGYIYIYATDTATCDQTFLETTIRYDDIEKEEEDDE